MIPAIERRDTRSMRFTIVQAVCRFLTPIALLTMVASSTVGAQEIQQDDPFQRRGWHVELGVHGALETWNYNGSHEEMSGVRAGFAYGLGNSMTFIAGWPLYYISQRGVDGSLFATTVGLRGRVYRHGRVSGFLEFEVGVSESDTPVTPRGTRFNYLALGGVGVTIRLRPGVHLLTGVKWIHVSNNGLAGRDRNPDIEAVGPHASVLVRF